MTTESVEIMDPDVQTTWSAVARSGVGELASAYVLSTAIVGLARSGVLARLSQDWAPLPSLVPEGGVPDLVAKFLRFLRLRGLVESDADDWRLTTRGAELTSELAENLLGYYVEAYGPVFGRIDDLLTGRAEYGSDVERDNEALGRRCEVIFRSFGTSIVRDLMKQRGARSLLDLGCGTGGLVLDLCREDPGLVAVGMDIAEDAIELALSRAEAEAMTNRATFVVGDAFQPASWPDQAKECDFYVAVGALHEHFRDGRAAVVGLLAGYRELLGARPGRTFLLAEPELMIDDADANFFLVHALSDQGFPRPRAPWLEVIEEAGLTCGRVYSAPNTDYRFAYYEITVGG
jgi:SAM-dependent methyltransferase